MCFSRGFIFGSILLTGCSLPKRDDISQADHSEARVYASSFTMTDILKENILTNSPHIMDNACYYQSIEWDAGSQNSLRHFYKFDMDNNISEPLVMDSQESGSTLFALAANEKDIYYIKKVEEDEEIFLCLEKWNGTELVNKQRLENVFAESYDILNFLNGFIIDENLLYLLEADGNVYVFLTDGSYQQNYKLPDAQQYTLVTDGSNNVFGICVESGKTKIYKLEKQVEDAIYEFPAESKGSPIAIESSLGEGLVWWNEEGIYFLNLTEKTSEQVVQWNNEYVNIEWNSVQKVTQISGQQYIILLSYSNDDYVDLARLYQVVEWSRDNQEINILEDMSIRSLLDYFLTKNLNDFIDWDQKECYFTKDEFIHFLSFIKSQAETKMPWSVGEWFIYSNGCTGRADE